MRKSILPFRLFRKQSPACAKFPRHIRRQWLVRRFLQFFVTLGRARLRRPARCGLAFARLSLIYNGYRRCSAPSIVSMSTQTIAVAMSGGVDSSTVAAMLRAQGHNVVGLTMQLWNQRRLAGYPGMPEQVQGRCCSIDDVYDARRVAEDLGIPYYVVNHE